MRGAGGGGADGRGAAGEALADTTADGEVEGADATEVVVVGRIVGAVGGGDATGGGAGGGDASGGVITGRAGTAGAIGDALAEMGAAGLVMEGGGATVVGRLTAAGDAATVFSTGVCTGGAIGRGAAVGGATASFRCVIAFNTSPGREMCDKSILVLISSSPRAPRELDLPAEEEPSAEERMYTRTFSASCSSRELECVFFSVTPTSGSVSRMALLLTSSSLARSLIRTLLIRPFVSPCCS
jgi:hypothetical protein